MGGDIVATIIVGRSNALAAKAVQEEDHQWQEKESRAEPRRDILRIVPP